MLKTKIREFDSDKIVKQAVAKCVGSVFEFLNINEEDWIYFLEMLSAKYKIEIDKIYIIEVLIRMRDNYMHSKNKNMILETLIKQVAEHLGSTNYELNAKSIMAINKMLPIVWQHMSKHIVSDLLEKSKFVIKEGSVP